MWRAVLLLLLLWHAVKSMAAGLSLYDQATVFDFINKSVSDQKVGQLCRRKLSQADRYLTEYNSTKERKEFFVGAFSAGASEYFSSRDQDRWVFRAYECVQAAEEEARPKSVYSLQFCYGYNEAKEKYRNNLAYGICIPDVCHSDKEELLNRWRGMISNGTDAVSYSTCTRSRHEKPWYRKFGPVAELTSHVSFSLLTIAAAIYEVRNGDQTKSAVIAVFLAFSAKKNFAKLVKMPKDPQSTITCMFGMRFLSMVWTVVGHSFVFAQVFIKNIDEYEDDIVNTFYNQWITNFTLSVDTFFVLSATLTSFMWFKKMRKCPSDSEPTWHSWCYWLRYYRHRIIRLWPAYIYALINVSARTSQEHYHPMWPAIDPAVQCPKYGWQNILFINSILPNRCMPWTWYIGTEFIFYLLSPIFLLSLWRSPTRGLLLSLSVIAVSSAINVTGMIAHNLPPTQFLWKQPTTFNTDFIQHHLIMYIKPHYRIGPYIVGLLLGYYLANIQKAPVKMKISFRCKVLGWTLAAAAGFWAIFGLYPSLQGWDWPVYHLVYGGLHRTVFGLAISWLIYACHTGIGGIVNSILSWKILLPLSSLCYSVYLFHMVVVVFTYLLGPFPIVYSTKWPIFLHCLAQLAFSYVFGIFCSMLAELPALNLEKIIFYTDRKETHQSFKLKDYDARQKVAEVK